MDNILLYTHNYIITFSYILLTKCKVKFRNNIFKISPCIYYTMNTAPPTPIPSPVTTAPTTPIPSPVTTAPTTPIPSPVTTAPTTPLSSQVTTAPTTPVSSQPSKAVLELVSIDTFNKKATFKQNANNILTTKTDTIILQLTPSDYICDIAPFGVKLNDPLCYLNLTPEKTYPIYYTYTSAETGKPKTIHKSIEIKNIHSIDMKQDIKNTKTEIEQKKVEPSAHSSIVRQMEQKYNSNYSIEIEMLQVNRIGGTVSSKSRRIKKSRKTRKSNSTKRTKKSGRK